MGVRKGIRGTAKRAVAMVMVFVMGLLGMNVTGCAYKVKAENLMDGITVKAVESKSPDETFVNGQMDFALRLFKENGNTKSQTINEMDLRLPTPTFAELDYVVFNIASLEYLNFLRF